METCNCLRLVWLGWLRMYLYVYYEHHYVAMNEQLPDIFEFRIYSEINPTSMKPFVTQYFYIYLILGVYIYISM